MAVIKKDAKGGRGTYATLAQVVNYVDEQGYELQWPTQLIDGRLYVDTAVKKKGTDKWIASNCLIPVEVGDSRGMSVMQALGSALTYARRYSTCGAFGLATTDDDGETSGYKKRSTKGMTDEQQQTIDRILQIMRIPDGQENGFISSVLQRNVVYGKLSESDAATFIESYNRNKEDRKSVV